MDMTKTIIGQISKFKNSSAKWTQLKCEDCGRITEVKGSPSTSKVKKALSRPCRTCSPPRNQTGKGWWHAFGLERNPGIYGPMPRKRMSLRWRLDEARQSGLNQWIWKDEYTHLRLNRKG